MGNTLRLMLGWLGRRGFWGVTLASGLALALLIGRQRLSGTNLYDWMLWNLTLAWLPYGLGLLVELLTRRAPPWPWRVVLPALAWLALFPNTLYLVTDLMHLHWQPRWIVWYDTGLLATFAWAGCVLAVASLRSMQRVVARYAGAAASYGFVVAVAALSGFGVYAGRFLRWNSWELVTHPLLLLDELRWLLLHSGKQWQMVGVSGMFALLLLVAYVSVGGAAPRPEPER